MTKIQTAVLPLPICCCIFKFSHTLAGETTIFTLSLKTRLRIPMQGIKAEAAASLGEGFYVPTEAYMLCVAPKRNSSSKLRRAARGQPQQCFPGLRTAAKWLTPWKACPVSRHTSSAHARADCFQGPLSLPCSEAPSTSHQNRCAGQLAPPT